VEHIRKKNAAMGNLPFVTYCTNCRDSFTVNQKSAPHLLDILFFGGENRGLREAPSLTRRRENRRALKKEILKSVSGVRYEEKVEPYRGLRVEISREILNKMDRLLIHEDNVKMAIHAAEKTGKCVLNKIAGTYTCHQLQGQLTFWLQYAKDNDNGYILRNIYRHRMRIDE